MLLNNNESKKKSKRKSENISRQKKMETQHSKIYGCSKSNSKREVYSNTGLPQEIRKTSNNLTSHLKELEKEEQIKPKVSKRKEIIKIREEINKIEIKNNRKVQ